MQMHARKSIASPVGGRDTLFQNGGIPSSLSKRHWSQYWKESRGILPAGQTYATVGNLPALGKKIHMMGLPAKDNQ